MAPTSIHSHIHSIVDRNILLIAYVICLKIFTVVTLINFTAWEYVGVCVISDREESPRPGTLVRRDSAGGSRTLPINS